MTNKPAENIRSTGKTALAMLRLAIGKPQKEFADILGMSMHTLQSYETRRKMSAVTESKVVIETNVNPVWLAQFKAAKKTEMTDIYWRPYTLESFNLAQSRKKLWPKTMDLYLARIASNGMAELIILADCLSRSRDIQKVNIVVQKLHSALGEAFAAVGLERFTETILLEDGHPFEQVAYEGIKKQAAGEMCEYILKRRQLQSHR